VSAIGFGALRIDASNASIDPDEFKQQLEDWARVVRASNAAPGTPGVAIPGDPERLKSTPTPDQIDARLRRTGTLK